MPHAKYLSYMIFHLEKKILLSYVQAPMQYNWKTGKNCLVWKKKGVTFYSVILTGQIAWIVMKIKKKELKKNTNILATQ